MVNFRFLVENDSNPLIVFNASGKITYLNAIAELLLGSCSSQDLYTLAVTYAPKSFGAKTTYIDLVYRSFRFYAINVLYENEEEIAIHLYKKPMPFQKKFTFEGYTSTDINILLEANIELFRTKYEHKITLFTDYDLPKIEIHQNNFSILLRKLFDAYLEANYVEISLKIKIGQTIKINEKKYPILVLEINADRSDTSHHAEIEKLAAKNYINYFSKNHNALLLIPCIITQPEK